MITEKIFNTVKKEGMFENCTGAVLAVSGGGDSMAMLNFFIENIDFPFAVGHINHCIRKEADEEEHLVENFCKKHGVPFYKKKIDIPKLSPTGTETYARERRYEFLNELRWKLGYSHIVTAHNADDNTETFLLNLIRGSGSNGACAIPPLRDDKVARPLINVSKKEILEYCHEKNIPYATDMTNFEPICKRNVLRNQIIPQLKKLNPAFDTAVSNYIEKTRIEYAFISKQGEIAYKKAELINGIEVSKIKEPVLLRYCIRKAYEKASEGQALCDKSTVDIENMLNNSKNGSCICLAGKIIAEKSYGNLLFRKDEQNTHLEKQKLHEDDNTLEGLGIIHVSKVSENADLPLEYLDALYVKVAESGDKIKLREKGGTKSILKLYSDEKMPSELRKTNPVITYNDTPVYVWGFGPDINHKPKNEGLKIDFTDL